MEVVSIWKNVKTQRHKGLHTKIIQKHSKSISKYCLTSDAIPDVAYDVALNLFNTLLNT